MACLNPSLYGCLTVTSRWIAVCSSEIALDVLCRFLRYLSLSPFLYRLWVIIFYIWTALHLQMVRETASLVRKLSTPVNLLIFNDMKLRSQRIMQLVSYY